MSNNLEERRTRRAQSPSDESLAHSKNSIRILSRPKPGKVDIAEELGFKQSRLPDIGPGALKPSYGRGGSPVPVPDNYYGESDLTVPQKKGVGIGTPVKSTLNKDSKPKWSDVI